MDEENKSNDQDADEVFEIGIQIDDVLSSPDTNNSQLPRTAASDNGVDGEIIDDAVSAPDPEEEVADGSDYIPGPLDEIKIQLASLSQSFESKIKYDEHKNKIIDDLHHSLQEYRDGLIKKYLHRIIIDVIKIVDDMRKFTSHYNNSSENDETTEKFLSYIENIASDMEDLFSWEGVQPFTCEGDKFDPSRQRIIQKVETDDPAKDKMIAQRLRPGYEWDEKVIRPEMISAYIYSNELTTKDDDI